MIKCVRLLQESREVVSLPPVPRLDVYVFRNRLDLIGRFVKELMEMGGLEHDSISSLLDELRTLPLI